MPGWLARVGSSAGWRRSHLLAGDAVPHIREGHEPEVAGGEHDRLRAPGRAALAGALLDRAAQRGADRGAGLGAAVGALRLRGAGSPQPARTRSARVRP